MDDVFRIERLDAKERRHLVLRKPAQNDDGDRVVDGGPVEGRMHGDGGINDGRVVGAERRDDGVEQVGAVVLRRGWEKQDLENKNRAVNF